MSQPPSNFDPTATLLPRVDAPISIQTGGGYYDTKVNETLEQSKNTNKIIQSGGDFTVDEKAILAKYSIGPKLQAQIGESTLREFIQQIQTPKCSAGAGAGILLHKDCWAVQAVITHLLRASLPGVIRKSNINPDIRYSAIPASDQIDLSVEGFGKLFSQSEDTSLESKQPEETPLFRKRKELYQLVEKIPFMGIQVLLREEIKQKNDIPALLETQKKIAEVQQFKKDRDVMMKKVAEGKVLISQLEKVIQEKRAKTPGPAVPTLMNEYISDITRSKTLFQEFEEEFKDSKILSFEIIRDFNGISEDVNEHITTLEKEKRAIDPSFFQKISQKIKPSDEVKHIQESYTVLVSKEEKIDYLHSIKSKGIFPGFPFDTIIEDYTNASYSQNAQDHLYYESVISHVISQLKYLEEMNSEENTHNIPFKTLYDDCIRRYFTIQDIPTLQEVYDRMNNIETASIELLRAANQLEDLATRVNMVVEKIEEEKKGLEKKVGGAIDKTKDILPQLNDITEEVYEIKEEIEVIIGVNGNPGTAETYNADLKDLVLLLKEYNTRIGDLQKDLNEALSILNPSFAIFKKKTDLQTKITEEIKQEISKTKKSEMLEVLGTEIQELLSTPAEAFFSEVEVEKYTGFYNSSLAENKSKQEIESAYNFYIEIFKKADEILRWNIPENITKVQEGVPQSTPLFTLLQTFQETYNQEKPILERLLHQVFAEFPQDQAVYMTTINTVYTEMKKLLGYISDILEIKEKTIEFDTKIPVEHDKIKRDFQGIYIQKISSPENIPIMKSFMVMFEKFVPFFEKNATINTKINSLQNARIKSMIYEKKTEFENKYTEIINQLNITTELTTTIEEISTNIATIQTLIEQLQTKYTALIDRFDIVKSIDKVNSIEGKQESTLKTLGDDIQRMLSTPGAPFFTNDEVTIYTSIYKKLQESSPNMEQGVMDTFVTTCVIIFQKVRNLLQKNIPESIDALSQDISQDSPVLIYITSLRQSYTEKLENIQTFLHDILTQVSTPAIPEITQIEQNVTEKIAEIQTLHENKIKKLATLKEDVSKLYTSIDEDIFGGEIKMGVGEIFTEHIRSDEDIPKIREFLTTIQSFFRSYPDYSRIQEDFKNLQNQTLYDEIHDDVKDIKDIFNEILNSLRTTFEQSQNLMEIFGDDAQKTTFIARIIHFNEAIDTLVPKMGRTTLRNQKVVPQTTKPFIEKQIAKLSPELQTRYQELLEDAELPNQIVEVGQKVHRAIEYERTKKGHQELVQKQIETIQSLGKKLGINFAEIDRELGIAPTSGGTRKKRMVIKKKKATRQQYGGDSEEDKRKLIELYKQLRKTQQVMKKENVEVEQIEKALAYVKGPMLAELPKLEEILKRVDISGFQTFKSWFSKKQKDVQQTTQQVQQDLRQGAPPDLQESVPPQKTKNEVKAEFEQLQKEQRSHEETARRAELETSLETRIQEFIVNNRENLYSIFGEEGIESLRTKKSVPEGETNYEYSIYVDKLLTILDTILRYDIQIKELRTQYENEGRFKTNQEGKESFQTKLENTERELSEIATYMKDNILISQYTTHSDETRKISDIEIKLKSYAGNYEKLQAVYTTPVPISAQKSYEYILENIKLLSGSEDDNTTLRGRFTEKMRELRAQNDKFQEQTAREYAHLLDPTEPEFTVTQQAPDYKAFGIRVYDARRYLENLSKNVSLVEEYIQKFESLEQRFVDIQTKSKKANIHSSELSQVRDQLTTLRELQAILTNQNPSDEGVYKINSFKFDEIKDSYEQLQGRIKISLGEKLKTRFTQKNKKNNTSLNTQPNTPPNNGKGPVIRQLAQNVDSADVNLLTMKTKINKEGYKYPTFLKGVVETYYNKLIPYQTKLVKRNINSFDRQNVSDIADITDALNNLFLQIDILNTNYNHIRDNQDEFDKKVSPPPSVYETTARRSRYRQAVEIAVNIARMPAIDPLDVNAIEQIKQRVIDASDQLYQMHVFLESDEAEREPVREAPPAASQNGNWTAEQIDAFDVLGIPEDKRGNIEKYGFYIRKARLKWHADKFQRSLDGETDEEHTARKKEAKLRYQEVDDAVEIISPQRGGKGKKTRRNRKTGKKNSRKGTRK